MKSIYVFLILLVGIVIGQHKPTQAQSFRILSHPNYPVFHNYNITFESGKYYFCSLAQDLSQPNFVIYPQPFISQVSGNDTMMRLVPLEFGLGVTAWNGRPYIYKKGFSPSRKGMRITLAPLDSQLNLMSDSIVLDSILTNGWNFKMKSRVANNRWLYSYSSHDTTYSCPIPAMLVYNFQTGSIKHRLFQATKSIDYPSRDFHQGNPAIFPHDSGYYVAFDTSFLTTSNFDDIATATSFLDLDPNLNTRSNRLLNYPFAGPGLNTGLKSVRDFFPLGSQKLFVGIVNRYFNNTNYQSYTNDVGIMRYDSNWNVIDTIRIVRPGGVSLNPSLENAACWCNGSLFTVSNLSLDSNSSQFGSSANITGLMLAKIDTPLQRRWTRTLFFPSSFLNAEMVNCVNGKIQVAGNYYNSTSFQSGYFLLEMDTHGNYLPLESSDIAKSAIGAPYPNPFNQEINLPETEIPIKQFVLYDLHGRRLYEKDYPEKNTTIPPLKSGIYLWEITLVDDQQARGKLVRE